MHKEKTNALVEATDRFLLSSKIFFVDMFRSILFFLSTFFIGTFEMKKYVFKNKMNTSPKGYMM